MKKSLKKGGIADIVTLVIIVGVVLALIAVVLNGGLIQNASNRAVNASENDGRINTSISTANGVLPSGIKI